MDRFDDNHFRYQDSRRIPSRDSQEDCRRCIMCEKLLMSGSICTSCQKEEDEREKV